MLAWLSQNWFDVIQTAGIAGSLLFAGWSMSFDGKVRRTELGFKLAESHRDIWEQMIDRPELSRVLDPDINLGVSPILPEEQRFVNLVILHLASTRKAVLEGVHDELPGLDDDVRTFFSLPIPSAAAESILKFQSPEFRQYFEKLMN